MSVYLSEHMYQVHCTPLLPVEVFQTCKAAISATETERGRFESPSRRLLKVVKIWFKKFHRISLILVFVASHCSI